MLSVCQIIPHLVHSALLPSSGRLMAPLQRDADLCQSNGGCDAEGPQPLRPGLVWSFNTDWLPRRLRHHVPAGQRLQAVYVRRLLQHSLSVMINDLRTTEHRRLETFQLKE